MKNQILLLGVGWLGKPLAKALVKQGNEVLVLSRTPHELSLPGITAMPWGLPVTELKERIGQHPVCISALPPKAYFEDGHEFNAWLGTVFSGISWDQVIAVSSTASYPAQGTFMEHEAINQKSPHSGMDMLALEEFIGTYAPRLSVLRFGGLFGPNRKPGGFLLGRGVLKDSNHLVNATHLDDGVNSILTLLAKGATGSVYNVVSPNHPTRLAFYQAALGEGINQLEISESDGYGRKVNSEAIQNELGYTFAYPNPLNAL